MNNNVALSLFSDKLKHSIDEIELNERKEIYDRAQHMYICKRCKKPSAKFIMNYQGEPVYARVRCGCDVISGMYEVKEETEKPINKNSSFEKSSTQKSQNFRTALNSCKKFCENIDKCLEIGKGIYLHGGYHSGKTYLLECMSNELMKNKKINYALFDFPEIIKTAKNHFSVSKTSEFLNQFDVLLIDNLTLIDGIFFENVFISAIHDRYENKKPTIFTSSSDINSLQVSDTLKNLLKKSSKEMCID